MPILYTTIASGTAVSPTVDLSRYSRPLVLGVPAVISGDLLVQGAFDTTSGSFSRLLETRVAGSGDLRFATGPGSRMVMWPETLQPPPYVRLESAVTQTSPATLSLLVRG